MSLINVDVKIITKALAKRIRKVLPSIIYKSQTCILGSNISYNIHNLIDIIKYANIQNIQENHKVIYYYKIGENIIFQKSVQRWLISKW